jgi:hypothetical protein
MLYADASVAMHLASLQHRMLACSRACIQPRRQALYCRLALPPSATTLMAATCTRCRHPRTPSCPTNMHHSITQALHCAGSLIAAIRISPPLCDGHVPGTRCAPPQKSGCARMRAPGACNLQPPRHAREPILERSADHRLMFQHSTWS